MDESHHDGTGSVDMAMTMKTGASGGAPPTQLPKCFCNWKFCRTYQKAFREFKHPFYNGVIKLKFYEDDPRSIALKESIDRTLHVEANKRNDWKRDGQTMFCRYYVARHHFTEKFMTHYLNDRRSWDWNEPLTEAQAEEFLFSLDPQDVYVDDGEDEGEPRYVQTPNVPKDHVRELLKRLKDHQSESQKSNGAATTTSSSSQQRVPLASQDEMASQTSYGARSSNQQQQSKPQKRNSSSTHVTAKSTITKDEILIENGDYDSDEEEYDDDNNGGYNKRNNGTANRKYKEDSNSSNSHTIALLKQKDEENMRLRADLNDCKKQIDMLQNVVAKLQVRLDLDDDKDEPKPSQRKKRESKPAASATKSARSRGHESYASSDEDDGSFYNVKNNRRGPTESEDSSEEETSNPYNYNQEYSTGRRTSVSDRSIKNRASLRRTSIHSRRSTVGRSRHQSRRGSVRGGDDGASVMSRQSLQSISVSIKSLPREIELMDELEDEEDNRATEDNSYYHDTGSVGSRSAASRVSRRSIVSNSRIRRRSQRGVTNPNTTTRQQRRPRQQHEEGIPPEIDLSGDELDGNGDVTHQNTSNDTLYVKDKQIVDPYGEKGVYSGALSKSTLMPNGQGRLEYEKESRWYEGDWIHGRWTGYGKLSNGDGDFYEGGLKNDHKHGTGIMKFADGRVFEGEYIRGQMIQGKMTYQDGSIYGGSWVDGMRHGRGKCIFVDGSQYEGDFREGNFHGHGKMTWNDGGWYVGNWCNGEMDGLGKEVRPDGSLRHDGKWSGGQPIRDRRRRQQRENADDA